MRPRQEEPEFQNSLGNSKTKQKTKPEFHHQGLVEWLQW
jgi:hypothetical protein